MTENEASVCLCHMEAVLPAVQVGRIWQSAPSYLQEASPSCWPTARNWGPIL